MHSAFKDAQVISIHTTTQVVTFTATRVPVRIWDFNPHHHAGGDYELEGSREHWAISIHTTTQVVTKNKEDKIMSKQFQSTPPRRW